MYIEIHSDGEKTCFKENWKETKKEILHNEYGPALHAFGSIRHYLINDELHNLYGPAIINDGAHYYDYFINGRRYTKKRWERAIQKWL